MFEKGGNKKMEGKARKILPTRDEVRHIIDIIHYAQRPERQESSEFSHNKKELHEKIKAGLIDACFINNGHCEGQTEIHHLYVEYSAWTGIDILKVKKVVDIEDADSLLNLIPLCRKHHMGVGTGIHFVTWSSFQLQKFMNDESIALFEAAVKHLKEEMHPNHEDESHDDHAKVNKKAEKLLKHLTSVDGKKV